MEDKKITMPAVALRGLTVLPGMVQHFDISRWLSVRVLEKQVLLRQSFLGLYVFVNGLIVSLIRKL